MSEYAELIAIETAYLETPEGEYSPQWKDSYEAVTKPFPNEHAARLKNPNLYSRFRRRNNFFKPGIHAIFGRLKTTGKAEVQSIRFDAKKFTVAQAKKWLKNHDFKPIVFEPATGAREMEDFEPGISNVDMSNVGAQGLDWTSTTPHAEEKEKAPHRAKYGRSYVVKSDNGDIRFRLTERKVDRDGEVVESAGVVLDSYLANPIVLWGHGRTGIMGGVQGSAAPVPIGRIIPESVKQTKTYVDGDVQFDESGTDQFASMIASKVRNGFLNTGSIGFIPIVVSDETVLPHQTGKTFVKSELVEFSIVPVPSLRSATARRDFDELVAKCAEYDHPLYDPLVDIVSNWFDTALDKAIPSEATIQNEALARLRLEAAITSLQLALLDMR